MHFDINLKQLGCAALIGLASASAYAEPGDETCFPLYRDAGAIPNTSSCPYIAYGARIGMGTYFCTATFGIGSIARYCGTAPKDAGPSYNGCGNPINSGTGNKYQIERDYDGSGLFPLVFERYYNSTPSAAGGASLGKLWRSTYDRAIVNVNASTMAAYRHDGKILFFKLTNGAWVSDKDISDRLVQLQDAGGATTGWVMATAKDESAETYDANGRLASIKARNGQIHTLTRSTAATPASIAPGPHYLIRITDHFGRELNLTWTTAGYLATVADPDNQQYRYAYDGNGRLLSVTYPDATTTPKRIYAYNEQVHTANTALPNALTGITDENNIRYATFTYDGTSRAISTSHASGVDRYSMTYGVNQTTVVDALNTSRTYNFAKVLGAVRRTGINQPGGAGCNAASNSISYDPNGNIASSTDWNGTQTTYLFDLNRNLETSRTEAAGTAQARTITTAWHATYRLPKTITEPGKVVAFDYDANGNLLTKTITADGKERKWTYTYNDVGQVMTATGPRTDVIDKTTYTYDGQGNVASITDALGHITHILSYNAHGKPLTIIDANGLTTTLAYNARQRLTSKRVGDEITGYTYDAVGQLTLVTLPDASTVTYTYDDAHRLTDIADSLGNRIAYTLDNMGNRIGEQVTDPSGTLARQTTRVYDALNRLQTITGAAR